MIHLMNIWYRKHWRKWEIADEITCATLELCSPRSTFLKCFRSDPSVSILSKPCYQKPCYQNLCSLLTVFSSTGFSKDGLGDRETSRILEGWRLFTGWMHDRRTGHVGTEWIQKQFDRSGGHCNQDCTTDSTGLSFCITVSCFQWPTQSWQTSTQSWQTSTQTQREETCSQQHFAVMGMFSFSWNDGNIQF